MTLGCFRKCLPTAPPPAVCRVRLTEALASDSWLGVTRLGTGGRGTHTPLPPSSVLLPPHHPGPPSRSFTHTSKGVGARTDIEGSFTASTPPSREAPLCVSFFFSPICVKRVSRSHSWDRSREEREGKGWGRERKGREKGKRKCSRRRGGVLF